MIIILEGCRGTGKTTTAQRVAEQLGAIVLRTFHPSLLHHHDGKSAIETELKALDMPINTHVDDLYIADIIGTIVSARPDVHIVLDRSMGSAVAHGTCPADVRRLLRFWQDTLGRAGAVGYVWLRASYATSAQRVVGRSMPPENEYDALEARFWKVYRQFNIGPKMMLTTDKCGVDYVVGRVLDMVARNFHGQAR